MSTATFRLRFQTAFLAAHTSLLLCSSAQDASAQVVDIAEEARASREQLAAEIAAVDAAVLRAHLLSSSEGDRLAHWYAGEVWVDDQWLTLDEAQQQAANDKDLSAYRELRAQAADRLADHERLARWSKKHDLQDLAHMHWLQVLRFNSAHRAALSELDLSWHQGMLMTQDEAERHKRRESELAKQKKVWRTKARRLRRDLEQGKPQQQVVARQKLRKIREPAAVPALLEVFTESAKNEAKTIARQTELLATLGGISSPNAVDVLVEFALMATNESVRYAAIDQLKAKPYQEYIPQLLSELQMPLEASVSINQIGNRIVNHYVYAQDTPYGERERSHHSSRFIPGQRYFAVDLHRYGSKQVTRHIPSTHQPAFDCNGHTVAAVSTPARSYVETVNTKEYARTIHYDNPAYDSIRKKTLGRSRAQATETGNQIARRNNELLEQNERIAEVLTEVTGETLSAFPKSWWNWWGDYLGKHPDIANTGSRQQLNKALLSQQSRGLARGTWVWTRRGKKPIETVLPGDYVLAQDPGKGELAFQVVLAIATPQEMAVSVIEVEDSTLYCAPGHVVWTTGSGWQRVSQLTAGQTLHGATSEARIEQVDTSFEIDSYDLIVEGFHTFFVGEEGLLVHDATPIAPTPVALPGFSPAAVADAAQLAAIKP